MKLQVKPGSVHARPVPCLKEDQSWEVDWYCSRLSWRASATERHMRMPSSLSGMRMFSIFDVAMKRFTLLMLVSAALRSHHHPPLRAEIVIPLALHLTELPKGEQRAFWKKSIRRKWQSFRSGYEDKKATDWVSSAWQQGGCNIILLTHIYKA